METTGTSELLLEVVGEAGATEVAQALGGELGVRVWPYARLGDATLQLSFPWRVAARAAAWRGVEERLAGAGLRVLGGRWAA